MTAMVGENSVRGWLAKAADEAVEYAREHPGPIPFASENSWVEYNRTDESWAVISPGWLNRWTYYEPGPAADDLAGRWSQEITDGEGETN